MAARVTIMAGGTGGHVFPALAVARELSDRGWQVSWLGTPDSFESRQVPQHGFDLDTIQAHRLRGQGLVGRVLAPFRLLRAMGEAARILRRRRPQVVLGMGGFVAAPGGLVSRLLGIPLVIHEQNAIPGMANRWLARVASQVLEAFPGSFPTDRGARAVGNPVRREIAAMGAPHESFEGRTPHLLVLGGSLGAQVLNEELPAALAAVPASRRPLVRHQAGRGKVETTASAYAVSGVEAAVAEFVDDMAEAYAWADLVVCRAGALTVCELMAAGRPAVLVPYPHAVDDHQTANARFLTAHGAARLLSQSDLDRSSLGGLIDALLADPVSLLAMGRAAHALAQRDAAQRVADVCEELAA